MFTWMLPLFDQEGVIGAASGAAESSAPPSVAAGAETPGAGTAPAPAPTSGTTPAPAASPDVTQQESFAARLKEERTKLEADYAPHKATATRLEKIAKNAGFKNTTEYLAALDSHVTATLAEAEAERLGVDQETYNKFFAPVHSELESTKSQLQKLQQAEIHRQIKADYEGLKQQYGADFESIQDKVFDLAEQRGLPLVDAFKLLSFDTRVSSAKLEGQAAAVAAIKQNAQSSTGAAGGDAPDQRFDFTKLTPDQRQAYYEKAKRGELKSLR
ncbi:hypothetical protein [Paenibacillus koleovorans]|uniref:hypothetical protein n=1 Tax=Paenibacillus koleovorans TaxID=121608 RepID=UPI000FDC7D32|nr:hypothetical protein [Paenibacillus koleovorans]